MKKSTFAIIMACIASGFLVVLSIIVIPLMTKGMDKDTVLGRAQSAKVRVQDLENVPLTASLPPTHYLATPQGRTELVEMILGDKILAQKAKRSDAAKDPRIKQAIEEYRERAKKAENAFIEELVMHAYLHDLETNELKIDSKEMRDYYNQHKSYFDKPVHILASHLLFADREEAQTALERLKKGEKFSKIPNLLDEKGQIIGEIGLGTLEDMPELEKAFFQLNPGEFSGVIESKMGYHIVKKNGEVRSDPQTFEQAQDQIRRILRRGKLSAWMNHMKEDWNYRINGKALANLAVTFGESAQPPIVKK